MKRRILIAVLALGTIGGYGSAFAHMRHMRGHCGFHRESAGYGCNDGSEDARLRGVGRDYRPEARDFRPTEDTLREVAPSPPPSVPAAPADAPK